MEVFASHLKVNVIRVNAEDLFLQKLSGVADPEEKRRIIGNAFIEILKRRLKIRKC